MGKHKHSKDKVYKTVSELKSQHDRNNDLERSYLHRRLRFDSCCLSLSAISSQPYGLVDESQFCYVFERDLILQFLEKFRVNPITGLKITKNDLIPLQFHKNDEGQYHCPVTFKIFNQHSKIVANKKSGNVFSFEAYQQLNLKANHLKDLLTDEPFQRSDIVTIQDPIIAADKWNVVEFYYVKQNMKLSGEDSTVRVKGLDESSILKSSLVEAKRRASSLNQTHERIFGPMKTDQDLDEDGEKLDKINSANHSDGRLARSVTSTVMPVTCSQTPEILNKQQILYPRIKKKGYAQLVTNFGTLNLELYCDRTPRACHNFLLLASRGYYDNVCFHRLLKNFIIQGGDPTGTGKGGQSAWGEPFGNECFADLKHEGRGVLAMANSGPNSNKSQFYITLKGVWDHLDGKHTIFGRVVGGEDTLSRIEDVEVDKNDKPKKEIKIIRVVKHFDPFEELELALDKERESGSSKKKSSEIADDMPPKKLRAGVGAYMILDKPKKTSVPIVGGEETKGSSLASKLSSLKPNESKTSNKFGNFSNW